jgi:thioesterase domain-containing protein
MLASPSFAASFPDLFGSLLNGATLLTYPIKEGSLTELARWMESEQATTYHSVPSLFRRFARGLSGQELFPALRLILLGGEPTLKSDVQLFQRHFTRGCRLQVSLGSTETNIVRRFLVEHTTEVTTPYVPLGYPVEDMEIVLLDEGSRPVPFNHPGEIVVKSRYLPPGYWKRPELTRSAFRPDAGDDSRRCFHTGDLGVLRPDGCLLHMGRKDMQVKLRGIRIQLEEIEAELLGLGPFAEAVVVPIEDEQDECRLVAYLVARDQAGGATAPPSSAELKERLARTLPEAMIPSAFLHCGELPRTPTGKVDRRSLKARPVAWTDGTVERPPGLPRTTTQSMLLHLVGRIVGASAAHLDDALSALGAGSLQWLELARSVQQAFAKTVALSFFGADSTLRGLADAIDSLPAGVRLSTLTAAAPTLDRSWLFCVPALAEGIDRLRPLALGLGSGWNCHGLEYGCDSRIEAVAENLLAEMTRVQPRGPYHLCGYSFGGWIAYEAARRLSLRGHEIGLLILVDTRGPSFPRLVHSRLERVVRSWRLLRGDSRSAMIAGLRQMLQGSRHRHKPCAQQTAAPGSPPDTWAELVNESRQNRDAYLSRLAPHRGPIVLLRADWQPDTVEVSSSDRFNGLRPYAPGGIRVIEVPGSHGTLIDAPELAGVVAALASESICRPASTP